ncbi:LamG domain-containing protein, partial [Candidatus Woesearchaeota archaeon]|nr:LamG domain-containing protein [Candidatus Woesearchaeota archaeon]
GGNGGTILLNGTTINITSGSYVQARGGNARSNAACSTNNNLRGNGGKINITGTTVAIAGNLLVDAGNAGGCGTALKMQDATHGYIYINNVLSPCNTGTLAANAVCRVYSGIQIPNGYSVNTTGNISVETQGELSAGSVLCTTGACSTANNFTIVANELNVSGKITSAGGDIVVASGSNQWSGHGGTINLSVTNLIVPGRISVSTGHFHNSSTDIFNGGNAGEVWINATIVNVTSAGQIEARGGNGRSNSCLTTSGSVGNGGVINVTAPTVSIAGNLLVDKGNAGGCVLTNRQDGKDGFIYINGNYSPCNTGLLSSNTVCQVFSAIRIPRGYSVNTTGNISIWTQGEYSAGGALCATGVCEAASNFTIIANELNVSGKITSRGADITSTGGGNQWSGHGGTINLSVVNLIVPGLISVSTGHLLNSSTNIMAGNNAGEVWINATIVNVTSSGQIEARGGNGETDQCTTTRGNVGNGGVINVTAPTLAIAGNLIVDKGNAGGCVGNNRQDSKHGFIYINGVYSPCNTGTLAANAVCRVFSGIQIPNGYSVNTTGNISIETQGELSAGGDTCSGATCEAGSNFTIKANELNVTGKLTSDGGDTTASSGSLTCSGKGGTINISVTTLIVPGRISASSGYNANTSLDSIGGNDRGTLLITATSLLNVSSTGILQARGGNGETDQVNCGLCARGRRGAGGEINATGGTIDIAGFLFADRGNAGGCTTSTGGNTRLNATSSIIVSGKINTQGSAAGNISILDTIVTLTGALLNATGTISNGQNKITYCTLNNATSVVLPDPTFTAGGSYCNPDSAGPSINFVDPTPTNGVVLPSANADNCVVINASIIDALTSIQSPCTLEWNSVNESGSVVGSGLSVTCYVNKCNTIAGTTYSYKIFANDTLNNMNFSATQTFAINNQSIITINSPANATTTAATFRILNVTVDDRDDTLLNVSFYGGNSTGTAKLIGFFANVTNGSLATYNWTSNIINSSDTELIGFWRLDMNASDFTSNAHNGAVNGATPNLSGGKLGGAYMFDGNDHINISNTIKFNITDTLSILAWIKGNTSLYGDGSDGALTVSSADTVVNTYTTLSTNVTSDVQSITVGSGAGFSNGDEILIIQMQNGTSSYLAGRYEFAKIFSGGGTSTFTLATPLKYAYGSGKFDQASALAAQVIRVPEYSSVTINSGASITATAWNGTIGGIVAFRSQGTVTLTGGITVTGKGFRGKGANTVDAECRFQGESYPGKWSRTGTPNGGGGAGGPANDAVGAGGGSYGSQGGQGGPSGGGSAPGNIYGVSDLSLFHLGSGGATGEWNCERAGTGAGGVMIFANTISASGQINVTGENGGGPTGGYVGSSGGSGGSVLLVANSLTLGTNLVNASGGIGFAGYKSSIGGDGGSGRIALYYNTLSGATTPAQGYTGNLSNFTSFSIVNKKNSYGVGVTSDQIMGFINNNTINYSSVSSDWRFVALTYDKSNIKLYVDGALQSSVALTDSIYLSSNNIVIGLDGSYYFNGSIDEVAVWNRTLSATEIQDLYRLTNGTYYWRTEVDDGVDLNVSKLQQFTIGTAVSNNAPTLNKFELYPARPTQNNNLKLNATCSDVDVGDTLTVFWSTFKNNANQAGLAGSQTLTGGTETSIFTIGNGNISIGELWNATGYCNDGTVSTTTYNTSRRLIMNSATSPINATQQSANAVINLVSNTTTFTFGSTDGDFAPGSGSTTKWAGVHGNVTSNITLRAADEKVATYFGAATSKLVFASQDTSLSFSTMKKIPPANIDTVWGFTVSDADSATNLFTKNDTIGTIQEVSYIPLNGAGIWKSSILTDNSSVTAGTTGSKTDYIFAVEVDEDKINFKGGSFKSDYELMVPSIAGSETYYFYVQVG